MDNESYEQFGVPVEGFEDRKNFLKEGSSYKVVIYENNPIDLKIPFKAVYEVTEAEEGVKGNTVTGATKVVTIETGFQVRVPIFIKQNEKIMINTETGEYVERVNS
jgi:elongation factor P